MTTTILIPARGGSKRVPRKGLQKVGGKTLIERAVETATGRGINAIVLVASDDKEMLAIAHAAGVDSVELPGHIASGDNGVPEICKWYYEQERARNGYLGENSIVAVIQPTSPFVSEDDVRSVVHAMERCNHLGIESVVSVTVDGKGYRRNGAIYATLGKHWLAGQCVAGPTLFHVMPPERSIDIDTVEDLQEARRMAGDRCYLCGEDYPPCSLKHPYPAETIEANKQLYADSGTVICGSQYCFEPATSYVRESRDDPRQPRCTKHSLPPGRDKPWMYVSKLDGQ